MATRLFNIRTSAIRILFLATLPVCFETMTVAAQDAEKHAIYPRAVLLLRHAEKPPETSPSVDLTLEGKARAEKLKELFTLSVNRPEPFPTPDFIFAAQNSKHSHRAVETVTPLAEQLKLTVNTDFTNEAFADLVKEILHNPKYANKTVLICWHHGNLPIIASLLKAHEAPASWKSSDFDRIWELDYSKHGGTTFRDRPQRLMANDHEK